MSEQSGKRGVGSATRESFGPPVVPSVHLDFFILGNKQYGYDHDSTLVDVVSSLLDRAAGAEFLNRYLKKANDFDF